MFLILRLEPSTISDRDNFYADVSKFYEVIKNIGKLGFHSVVSLDEENVLRDQCSRHIMTEIERIKEKLIELHNQIPFVTEILFYDCNCIYDNLRSVQENFADPRIVALACDTGKSIEEMFLSKFRLMQKKCLDYQGEHMPKVVYRRKQRVSFNGISMPRKIIVEDHREKVSIIIAGW